MDSELETILPRLAHFLNALCTQLKSKFTLNKTTATLNFTDQTDYSENTVEHTLAGWQKQTKRTRNLTKRTQSAAQALAAVNQQKDFIVKLLKQGKTAQVEQAINALVQNQQRNHAKPSDVCKSLCDLGARMNELGHDNLALQTYTYARQANSNDSVAQCGYAETLRSLGRLEEALQVYQDTRQRFANDEVAQCGYAETLRSLGRLEEAKQHYEKTIQQFPSNRVAKNAFACLLIELEDYMQARSLLNSDTPTSLDDWRDYHVLAMSYCYEGDKTTAEEMLRYGLEYAPSTSIPFFKTALGFLFIIQKQACLALAHLQLADNKIILFPQQAALYSYALAETDNKPQAQSVLAQVPRRSVELIDFCELLKRRYLTPDLIEAVEKETLDCQLNRSGFNLLLRAT